MEEITYEGYAPGATAILVQTLTENRNRTVAEVRNAFNRNAGNMGETVCVNALFEATGVIEVEMQGRDADELSLKIIDLEAKVVERPNPAADISKVERHRAAR